MCRMPTRCYRLVRLSRYGKTSMGFCFKTISSRLECHRVFCAEHSILHRHPSKQEPVPTTERYNRHVHLDQIAEWERKAIDKIRRQANEARRPLIAPPTPIEPVSTLTNQLQSTTLTRLLTTSSSVEKQVCRRTVSCWFIRMLDDSLVDSDRSVWDTLRWNLGWNDQRWILDFSTRWNRLCETCVLR